MSNKCGDKCAGPIIGFLFFIMFLMFLIFYETDAQKEKKQLKEDIIENPIEVKCVDGVKMWRDRSKESEFKQLFGTNGLPIECR